MTAAKEIKVTESYVGLGEEVTNCQTQETRSDCLARRHRGVASCLTIRNWYSYHSVQPHHIDISEMSDC